MLKKAVLITSLLILSQSPAAIHAINKWEAKMGMGGSSCGEQDELMGGSSCVHTINKWVAKIMKMHMSPTSGGSSCGSQSKGGAHDLTDTVGGL